MGELHPLWMQHEDCPHGIDIMGDCIDCLKGANNKLRAQKKDMECCGNCDHRRRTARCTNEGTTDVMKDRSMHGDWVCAQWITREAG